MSADASMQSWSFLALLRKLNAQHTDLPVIGTAERAQHEPVRLGQKASLAFAPREIADVQPGDDGRWHIRTLGLGMLGPNGAMPLHFTDWVRERSESFRDDTLSDFLDMFHHRFLTQFYAAWHRAQSVTALDRPDADHFSFFIDALGHTQSRHSSPLSAHARLAAACHLVRQARNPDGLQQCLTHFFQVPVVVQEFELRWMDIDAADVTRMGRANGASILGRSACLGNKVLDRQHQFSLHIGPVDLPTYRSFAPNGQNLPLLREWVRQFFGFEFDWQVQLRINPQHAPPAQLGQTGQLGWTSWLGQPTRDSDLSGMKFAPECGA